MTNYPTPDHKGFFWAKHVDPASHWEVVEVTDWGGPGEDDELVVTLSGVDDMQSLSSFV